MVLTDISMITNGIENLFMCLFAFCILSSKNVYSSLLPISILGCLLLHFKNPLQTPVTSPVSDT